MFLLIIDDGRNRVYRGRIVIAKHKQLLFQMPEHHALDGYRRCGDGARSKQAGDQTK